MKHVSEQVRRSAHAPVEGERGLSSARSRIRDLEPWLWGDDSRKPGTRGRAGSSERGDTPRRSTLWESSQWV